MANTNRGRPVTGAEAKVRYQVVLEPQTAEKLRQLGGDNLSRGIALAARSIPLKVETSALHVNANGLGDNRGEPPDPVEISMAKMFITQCCMHVKHIKLRGSSSYGWKHDAENWFQDGNEGGSRRPHGAPPYISNGAFIAAAIELGYKFKRIDRSLNALFNMSHQREAKARFRKARYSWRTGGDSA